MNIDKYYDENISFTVAHYTLKELQNQHKMI